MNALPQIFAGILIAFLLKKMAPGVLRAATFFVGFSTLALMGTILMVMLPVTSDPLSPLNGQALVGGLIGYCFGFIVAMYLLSRWDEQKKQK